MSRAPFPQSYWLRDGLACGCYPDGRDPRRRDEKLAGVLESGIRRIVNLLEPDEKSSSGKPFEPYWPRLLELAGADAQSLELLSFPMPDNSVPKPAVMQAILDKLDESVRESIPTFFHCWGGHGRTSIVVGCYLVRQGAMADAAIAQIMRWRSTVPKKHNPFLPAQEAFVRSWAKR